MPTVPRYRVQGIGCVLQEGKHGVDPDGGVAVGGEGTMRVVGPKLVQHHEIDHGRKHLLLVPAFAGAAVEIRNGLR